MKSLLANAETAQIITDGIAAGKSDVEIAKLVGSDEPLRTAASFRTARWHGVSELTGRTTDQDSQNRLAAGQAWRAANPEQLTQNLRTASQTAADKTRGIPVKYTPEIQEIIAVVLEEGGTYAQAAQALESLGLLKASATQFKHAADQWGITNRVKELQAERIKQLDQEVYTLAEKGYSRKLIREILQGTHTPGQIARALQKKNIRLEKIDWNRTLVGNQTLIEIAMECRKNHQSLATALAACNDILTTNGLAPLTYSAFKTATQRYRQEKNK